MTRPLLSKIHPSAFVAIAMLACVAASIWMLPVNRLGPFHRDGSHYLFMALNVLDGQAPYWAQFETKNPGVELIWALWHLLFGSASLTSSARVAETACVAVTGAGIALLVFRMGAEITNHRLTRSVGALTAGLVTTFLLSHWRVTDNGFNTAIYQSLFEAPCVALAWAIATGRIDRRMGWAIGVLCFLAWMVKQSSLLSLCLPLVIAAARRREAAGTVVRLAAIGFALPLALFAAHLWLTGTWPAYKAGAIDYQGLRLSLFTPGYLERLDRLLISAPWSGLSSWLRWLTALTLAISAAWIGIHAYRRVRHVPGSFPLGLSMAILWALGTLAQAAIPGTFFAHYWLALIGPCMVATSLFVMWLGSRTGVTGVAFLPALLATAYGVLAYPREADSLRDQAAAYPMKVRWEQMRDSIDMSARVALWGGLLHPWAYAGQPSRYPNNMWWSYIRTGYGREAVDAAMRRKYLNATPDYFIEMPETYPADQQLVGFALDKDVLMTWTGVDYCVRLDLPAMPGRYGGRVIVWQRCPAAGPS